MYVIRTLESRTVAEGNNPGRLNTRMCDVGQKKNAETGEPTDSVVGENKATVGETKAN